MAKANAKESGGRPVRGWRSRLANVLRAARAARNGNSAAPGEPPARGRRLGLCLLGLLFFAAAAGILYSGAPPLPVRQGEKARTDIKARVQFSYHDPDAYNQAREDARRLTPEVYLYTPLWSEGLLADVDKLVEVREKAKDLEEFGKLITELKLVEKAEEAELVWNAAEQVKDLRVKVRDPLKVKIEAMAEAGIVSDERWKEETAPGRPGRVERRPVTKRDESGTRTGLAYSETDARAELSAYIRRRAVPYNKPLWDLIERLVTARLAPNLVHNRELSNAAKDDEAAAVPSREAFRRRDKGDLLLRAGDEIRAKEMLVLRAENGAYWEQVSYKARLLRLGGLLLVLLALFGVTLAWIRRADPRALARPRPLAVLGVLALAALVTAKATGQFDWPVQVVPVVFVAMVAALAFSVRAAAALAVLAAALAALALGGSLGAAAVLASGSLAAVLAAMRPRHRLDILKAALVAGLAAAAASAGVGAIAAAAGGDPESAAEAVLPVVRQAGWGLGAALVQGLVLAGALPVLEAALGTATSISLLELCDQNQPVMKALFLNAPGSHQHSMVVGQLAETAAETVGADPLLARAGSHYHDIGKIARPEYFVENAPPGENRHDRLNPAMSAMVVTAHVRDGAELAREYRLPRAIIDVIEQHHGTTLVEFFYRRAAERGEEAPESVYRYAGPKPQSKEAAIVMLADTVEAASRTLEDPSAARIGAMVHELSQRRLLDGQFDECGLTLKELAAVESAFARILSSMFHARVAYPDANGKTAKPEGKPNGPKRP